MSEQQWTIGRLLEWISGYLEKHEVDSPRLSTEMLMSRVLGMPRIELYANYKTVVSPNKLAELRELVRRAGEHEPIAYIIGRTEFYSFPITLNKSCLIPRPETEQLAQRAIEFIREKCPAAEVLDMCTGSGCIAIAIAKNCPEAKIIATDISDEALEAAAENTKLNGVDQQIDLRCGDLYEPIISEIDGAGFDIIVCNPPYITDEEMKQLDKNVGDYEPHRALAGGVDGLDIYRRIMERIDESIKPGGALMMEIGYRQGSAISEMLESKGCFESVRIEKDFGENDRVAIAIKPA